MGERFHFVDGLRADRSSKRLMRRHVMKGKNVGKTFHRRSRREAGRRQRSEVPIPSQKENALFPGLVSPAIASKYFGGQTLAVSAPVDLTTYSLRIIDQFFSYVMDRMYPVQLGLTLEDSKRLWLQLLVADEASHHCSIALLQACNEIFLHDGNCSQEALHHLSRAYAHVQKRLETPDVSDSTIGLVLSFIHHEQIKRDRSLAKVHVDGMRKMVELRGGIGQLEGNLPLILKICKTDVIFALQYGGTTAFFRDRMPQVRASFFIEGHPLNQDSAAASVRHTGLDPSLHEILVDVLCVSSFFNGYTRKRRANLIVFQEMILSILYRLLEFQPLNTPQQGSDVEAAYHIGLTILTMTIFLQYHRNRVVDYRLTLRCLKDILDTAVVESESELALWIMIVAGVWVWDSPGWECLAPKLAGVTQKLELGTWEEVYGVLTKFPWVHCIHDDPGRQVWERACENGHV